MDENMEVKTAEIPVEPASADAAAVCRKCGAALKEGYRVCPLCGEPVQQEPAGPVICKSCGETVEEGHLFCPKCGQKVGQEPAPVAVTGKPVGKKKTPIIIAAIAVVAIIVIVAVVLLTRGTPVESIMLREQEITLKVGEHTSLIYTISPADATDQTVTWTSSNESRATVEDGTVYAVEEGSCTITVTTSNDKSATCTVIIESAGPDFAALYEEYCNSIWATVGADGSYLSIDTNPFDEDDNGLAYYEAYLAVEDVNKALGLPDSLLEEMGTVTGADGKQTEVFDDVTVSYKYHPDNGLEVTYKAN